MTAQPLTAADLAEALDCFWNAALGTAHNQQEGTALAAIMAEGMAAVSTRLKEIAAAQPPASAPLVALLNEARSDLTFYVNADYPDLTQPQRDSNPRYRRDIALVRRIEAALGAVTVALGAAQ